MKYILSWNSEVLQLQLLAGPLAEKGVAEQLKEIVIKNLSKLSEYSEKEAERRYLKALQAEDEEDDELVVYGTGASIRYGSGYEEYYHVVDYEVPFSSLFKGWCQEAGRDSGTETYIAIEISDYHIRHGVGSTVQEAKEALLNKWNEFFNKNITVEEFEEEYEIGIALWLGSDV